MWLSVEPVAKRTVCSFRRALSGGLSGRLLAALATGRHPYGLLRLCEPPVDAQLSVHICLSNTFQKEEGTPHRLNLPTWTVC